MPNLLRAALYYSQRFGWRVHPLQPKGKTPATSHGVKDASTNEKQIRAWWSRNPEFNIGIATGQASRIAVVDVDGAAGRVSLSALQQRHGPLPRTVKCLTGKGEHWYFKYPGRQLGNTAGKLGKSLDTRGTGGYVVDPPSIHPNGYQYRWAEGHGPHQTRLADMPDWLVDLLVETKPAAAADCNRVRPWRPFDNSAYGRAALDRECEELASTAPGQRNDKLNRVAFRAGQLVAECRLSSSEAEASILRAGLACGLKHREFVRTLQRGFRSGLRDSHQSTEAPAFRIREVSHA